MVMRKPKTNEPKTNEMKMNEQTGEISQEVKDQ